MVTVNHWTNILKVYLSDNMYILLLYLQTSTQNENTASAKT